MLLNFLSKISLQVHYNMNIIKNIKSFLIICCYQFIIKPFLLVRKPLHCNKKYNVVICGMFKNEAPFLKEWVEYHLLIGFEHFYLYNNNSDDNYKEVLNPYIERGIVTLNDWPYQQAQIEGYKHFYDHYRNECNWFSYLDIDEFFCLKEEISIYEWLKKHGHYPVIYINWLMFGTSGLMQHDYNKLVIEQYVNCWEELNSCGKCLINANYDIPVFDGTVHHATKTQINFLYVNVKILPFDQFGKVYRGEVPYKYDTTQRTRSTIQINHYWSKAWDIYDSKRKKTDVFFKDNPKSDLNYFYFHEKKNTSSSFLIFKYLMNLKINMNNIK